MDTVDIYQIIILVILLLLSALFSSTETALTTVNKIRMRTLSEAGNKKADRVLRVTENSSKMLSAILIGNNIVNLSASSLATVLATNHWGSKGAGIATGILTFLILIFGEISPKTLATLYADELSLHVAGFVSLLMWILTPVIFIINALAWGFLKIFRVDPNKESEVTEEEIRTIVDDAEEDGTIETEEKEMIHNLFDFGDSEAKEIMIPRIDMTFAPIEASYNEILEIFREDKFTRLPVYEDSTDNVVGILNMKDLLLCEDKESFSIKELIREPFFTFEHKNTADLFIEMRKSSIPLAIVLDEYGVTAGMITLEDLLEEIVGEIRDEYDTDEEDAITALNENEYLVLASINLDDLNDEIGTNFESEDYDTLGGYCLELLDHLPEENEIIITEEQIVIQIKEMDKNRIEKVRIKMNTKPLEEV